jgi:PAS domain S-box-containing protein
MGVRYKVLLVEDCVVDADLNIRALKRGGFDVEFQRVKTASQMKHALEMNPWDFILCDYHLPRFDGLAALALYKERGLDIPFIAVSGQIGEEQAVQMIKAGAHEYVMKDRLGDLVPAVSRELHAAEERCIRKRAQATEAYLASIVHYCDDAIIGETLDGSIVSWNGGAERLYGYTASEIIGDSVSVLVPTYRPSEQPEILQKVTSGQQVAHFETVRMRKNGTAVQVSLTVSPVREARGRIIGASTVAQDMTRRKQEESDRLGLIQDLSAALAQVAGRNFEAAQPATVSGARLPN